MTALEIDATMRSLDWQEAFRDAPPRRDLAFRRKQDDRNFLVRLPLGLKHGKFLLPKGFIQGAEAAGDAASTDPAVQQQHRFRFAAHPVSRRGDRFGDRPCRVDGQRRSRDRDARQHVGAGCVRAGRIERPLVGRRRTGRESTHQCRARDACGYPHRIGRELPLQPRAALDSALSISNQMLAILVRKDSDRQRATLDPAGYFDRAESGIGDRRRILPLRAPSSPAARARREGRRPGSQPTASATARTETTWRGAPRASPGCRSSNSCAWTNNPSAMKKPSWRRCSRWWESRWTSIR